VYEQQLICRVKEKPVPSAAALKQVAACVGYSATLEAAYTALNLLQLQLGNADQRGRAQAFVLSVLGLIPQTAGLTVTFAVENHLVDIIDNNLDPARYHPDFWASLKALWRSPAVANVLRSRGALQDGIAAAAAHAAEFETR
jgi:hypothetical protein